MPAIPNTASKIGWVDETRFPLGEPSTPLDEWKCEVCETVVGHVLHDTDDGVTVFWRDCAIPEANPDIFLCEGCVGEDDEECSLYSCDGCGKTVVDGAGIYVRGSGAGEERVCEACAFQRGMGCD